VNEKFTADTYTWMTQEEISKPTSRGLHDVILNAWWPIDKDGRVAFYNPRNPRTGRRHRQAGSPQCNENRVISEKVAQSCAPDVFVGMVQIPVAIWKVDPRDYGD
jgi:hypothetical protein